MTVLWVVFYVLGIMVASACLQYRKFFYDEDTVIPDVVLTSLAWPVALCILMFVGIAYGIFYGGAGIARIIENWRKP